jgi:2-polyprenyl-3-methyl-5-hydroxy-6-metoxy-1,4-benzoquinol methylase
MSQQAVLQIDPTRAETFGKYGSLGRLVQRQVETTPRHSPFLARRFAGATARELALCEEIARQIVSLAGDELDAFVAGYDFICDIQKREELYFRRHDAYRLKTVSEASAEVYSNKPYMVAYMRGLLMTQAFWSNHAASMAFYLDEFLARNPLDYDLLEIGPGHGLLFSRAAADPRARSVVGWDLSPSSVQESREALRKLGVPQRFSLEVRDLFDSANSRDAFDAVVFSEVLEHLEEPQKALAAIRRVMRPGGRLYVNVPINSPAPDHLFLLRSPEEAVSFVQSCGFEIERTAFFPATNYSLETARKHALTISVCMVGTKPRA